MRFIVHFRSYFIPLQSVAIAWVMVFTWIPPAQAESFHTPAPGDDLIGAIRHTRAHQEDTLIDIARRFSVGQEEMTMANPSVDRWLPKAGTQVLIPQEYILPRAPRAGVVVNIPEMRLYYFPIKPAPIPERKPLAPQKSKVDPKKSASTGKSGSASGTKPGAKVAAKSPALPPAKPQAPPAPREPQFESASLSEVITYPVSMGRMDWRTPIGKTSVVHKQKDPSWTPPASIKREHAAKGDPLPDVVPPGPDNPLGKFAMRLGVAGYLIHGTDAAKADGIGMRVTHGCMRMYNEDIAKLFPLIPVGSPVYLVNQPIKLGYKDSMLYMEVSQPLDEDVGISPHDPDDNVSKAQLQREEDKRSKFLLRLAQSEIEKEREKTGAEVSMDQVRRAIEKPTGIPVVIGGIGSGWERSAASDEGLAPSPKAIEEDPNALPMREKVSHQSAPPGASSSPYEARPYEQNVDDGGLDHSDPVYSPSNPYQPQSDSTQEMDSPPLRISRPSSSRASASGVRTVPLESSEPDPEEE